MIPSYSPYFRRAGAFWGTPWGMPYGYGYSPGWYGNYYGSNIIGSAIATNSLVNTGSMLGVNQIATPTVIW